MSLKYQKGFVYEGNTFVVNKSDIHNAKDEQFVEGTALLPIEEPKPLTLDELREMEGEPVFNEKDGKWHVIEQIYDDIINFTDGWTFDIQFDIDKLYRTKPEGSRE